VRRSRKKRHSKRGPADLADQQSAVDPTASLPTAPPADVAQGASSESADAPLAAAGDPAPKLPPAVPSLSGIILGGRSPLRRCPPSLPPFAVCSFALGARPSPPKNNWLGGLLAGLQPHRPSRRITAEELLPFIAPGMMPSPARQPIQRPPRRAPRLLLLLVPLLTGAVAFGTWMATADGPSAGPRRAEKQPVVDTERQPPSPASAADKLPPVGRPAAPAPPLLHKGAAQPTALRPPAEAVGRIRGGPGFARLDRNVSHLYQYPVPGLGLRSLLGPRAPSTADRVRPRYPK
jgi:hypothetical protein